MRYTQAVNWVYSLPRILKTPGIENTKKLLELLGNPQEKLHFVHVAGTNGKGSTVTMISNILQNAGYKTGSTISPFVLDFRERILLNNEMISKDDCAKILSVVRNAAEKIENYVAFDIVTAAAILYFERQKCDIVCLETGLGGRLDSSNAVQNTLVACIMSISKDHTELLGDTLVQIAREKCGIIKNNCSVICYPKQNKKVEFLIEEIAKKENCRFIVPDLKQLNIGASKNIKANKSINNLLNNQVITFEGAQITVPFAGEHQAYNASVAISAVCELRKTQPAYKIENEHIVKGIQNSRFSARIEVLSKQPLIILDGAHNVDGAKALVKTLDGANIKNCIGIIGTMKRKDISKVVKEFAPLFETVHTVTPDSIRAMSAQELTQCFEKQGVKAVCENNINSAIENALKRKTQENGAIVICGSLYLASQMDAIKNRFKAKTIK